MAATIDALIFDFDGTLVDTETPTFEVWRDVYRRAGCTLTLDEWQPAVGTHNTFDPYERLVARSRRSFGGPGVRAEIEAAVRSRCAEEPLRPEAARLLAAARAAGLPLAVASSASFAWVAGWLAHHRIAHHFEAVVCRDHVERVKPAPDLYLLAAARLAVDPARCVAVEDSPHGAQAAHSAGMRTLLLPNPITANLAFPPSDLTVEELADLIAAGQDA